MAKKKKATRKKSKSKKISIGHMVDSIHQVLRDTKFKHLHLHSLSLVSSAQAPGETDCPPGYVSKWVCESAEGGGVHCHWKCVPADQG